MKKINILSVVSLIILVITTIMIKNVSNLDELWNFNCARNIVNGLLPYKDFNMITTPLYPFINSILLSLDNCLYVFRINYILLILLNLFLTYKILSYLKVKYNIIFIYLAIIFFFINTFTYSDYNFFQSILILLIIYLELKLSSSNKIKLYNVLLGIVLGLTIVNKQTTGLVLVVLGLVMPFIYKYYLKEKIKLKKYLLNRGIGLLLPILIFGLYLTINDLWISFIDLSILGIKTFTNSLFVKALIPISICFLLFYFVKIIKVLKNKDKIDIIFILYSISSLVVIYPIFDPVHLVVGLIPTIVYFFYCLTKQLTNNKRLFNYLVIGISILLLTISFNNIYKYITNYHHTSYQVYKNLLIPDSLLLQLDTITDYLNKNDKVIMLSSDAAFYMIANNRYNKNYDLFNSGNFGYQGELDIYTDLDEISYTILINDNVFHYQRPKIIIDYVKSIYHPIGVISNYTIYKK